MRAAMMSGVSSRNSSSRSPEAIFISHATEDKDFVQTLVEHLAQKGFETWHQKEMALGGNYMSEIDDRLNSCKAGVVVWSRFSVTKDYVKAEANRLRERECLVPVYVEDCQPPIVFGLIHGIKCQNQRSLTSEEVSALCEAINKRMILGNKGKVLAGTADVRKTTTRSKIASVLSRLQIQQLSIGIALGMLLGHSLFQWYQSAAKADLDGFILSAGTLISEPITPDSKFPDSEKPITFARKHVPQSDGWATVIVDYWQEHYQAQKRIATMYCQTLNSMTLLYRQQFLANSKKADYLKIPNPKTPSQAGPYDTGQAASIDSSAVLERLKFYHCPEDGISWSLIAEFPASGPDR
jgi:hypothetical protein